MSASDCPGEGLHLCDLRQRLRGIRGAEPAREGGLHRDRGQRVAQQVVQVAGDSGAFVLCSQAGELRPRFGERVIAAQHLKEDGCHDRDDQDRDRGEIAERGAQALMPRGNGHRD
jgi:hypothetical protein